MTGLTSALTAHTDRKTSTSVATASLRFRAPLTHRPKLGDPPIPLHDPYTPRYACLTNSLSSNSWPDPSSTMRPVWIT